MLWTGPCDRHPRDEHVEQSDADDAQDGGARDDLLGVAGLLAVHRRRLEPDPRPEGKEEPESGAGPHDSGGGLKRPTRVDCLAHRKPIRAAAVEQHCERTQRKHEDLGQQEDTEDLGSDVDVVEGENRVQHQHQQGGQDPVHVDAEQRGHQVLEEEREDPDQRALEDHVRHGDQQTAGHADDPAKPVGDVAVEGTGGGEVLGHGGVADGEQCQHHGGEEIACGRVRTISEADRDGDVADHCGDRCRSGHCHEQHADDADGVAVSVAERHRVLSSRFSSRAIFWSVMADTLPSGRRTSVWRTPQREL